MSMYSNKQVVELDGGRRIEIHLKDGDIEGQVYVFYAGNLQPNSSADITCLTPPLSVNDAVRKYSQGRAIVSSTNHLIPG